MTTLLLLLLMAVAGAALALLYLIVRARNKRLLLAVTHCASCDAPDSIGISVLCSGVADLAHIENLLTAEYARYEIVVVLDSRLHPDEFAELAARYRMIRVEYAPTWELPAYGVRALGRSRKRSFRRVVLVDREHDTPEADFDAAASVASYDYLLPIRSGQYLLSNAIERLVTELGERPPGEVGLLRTWVGEPVSLYARSAVVAAGGFLHKPLRKIPRHRRKTLWEPICGAPRPVSAVRPVAKTAAALVLTAAGIAAAWGGLWPLAATLATATLVWAAAGYARQAVAEQFGYRAVGLVAWRRYLGKLSLRNFTFS